MPGEKLRWGCVVERGEEMKITVVGFLAVVGTIVLVAVLAYRLSTELGQSHGKSDGQQNHHS